MPTSLILLLLCLGMSVMCVLCTVLEAPIQIAKTLCGRDRRGRRRGLDSMCGIKTAISSTGVILIAMIALSLLALM
jgi:hypothetical protein